MKKLLKIGLILFGIGLVAGIGTYLYVFHKPHRNIAREKPAYVMDAKQLHDDFMNNEDGSYEKYGNKVIEVKGAVENITLDENSASIVFIDEMDGVNCAFDSLSMVKNLEKLKKVNVGDSIELKGQCDGYDMIMGVVLSRCVLL